MAPYMSFYGFKKNQIFTQNLYVLDFGFTENHLFVVKTDRNYIFHGRDSHITDQQFIMVPYMSFYGF
jgi:hypothetical protein